MNTAHILRKDISQVFQGMNFPKDRLKALLFLYAAKKHPHANKTQLREITNLNPIRIELYYDRLQQNALVKNDRVYFPNTPLGDVLTLFQMSSVLQGERTFISPNFQLK